MAGLVDALLRSAWPRPSVDNLLRAVSLPDRAKAATAWRDFESRADFDNLTFGEFRLISLAAKRLAELAPDSPMRPRIAGIERSVWSRSQVVIGEAATGLRKLAAASVEMLAVKGAGRAASGDPAARGRMVNDIDIVVRPGDLERAFDILVADGWTPSGSGSPLSQRSRLGAVAGINLVRGEFGNIDLHRTPFHAPFDRAAEDASIWHRSAPGKLGYAPVRVPAPLDATVIAIAHGSLDAHKASDWLADIAVSIDRGIDWDLFLDLTGRRRMQTAAAIALSYVRERLERHVPAEVVARLERAARGNVVKLVAAVAESRPKSDRFGLFWLARAVAKQRRLLRSRPARPTRLALASPFYRHPAMPDAGAMALAEALPLPGRKQGEGWSGTIEVVLLAEVPPASRRLEFEINAAGAHLLRLRAIVRDRGRRRLALRFRTSLSVPAGASEPVIEAVPLRSFNDKAPQELRDRYGPTPFRLLDIAADRRNANGGRA